MDTIGRYPGYTKDLTPAQQVALRLKIMDEYGMEEAVLFPTGMGSASKLREPEFAVAVCRAVNNHFAKDYNALSDRIHLLGALPMQQPPLGSTFYDPIYHNARAFYGLEARA
jgi:hypothetical protein